MTADRSAWLELLGDLPVDAEAMFPETGGFFARRANAARAKLLAKNASTLRRALQPGERIRYAALAMRYWFWETYFAGWASYHHNQHLLVLTDRRLLLLQITSRGNPADLKNQIALEEICGTKKQSFLNVFTLLTADGARLKLSRLAKRDRAALAARLPTAADPRRVRKPSSIEHLCPSCLAVVPGIVGTTLTCPEPTCRIPFRDPKKAARLSTWIPGLGDLYLRHHFFGATEFIGSTLMLGLALVLLLMAALSGDAAGWVAAGIAVPLLVGLPRIVDHRLTLHMARKGLVPLAMAPAPGAAARNLPSFPRWAPLLFAAGAAIVVGVPAAVAPDLAADARYDDLTVEQVEAGRFDEALAAYEALKAEGLVGEARRARLLQALYRAGDLEGAARVRSELDGSPLDEALVKDVNAMIAAEEAAIEGYYAGLHALVEGDEAAAWKQLDPALAYFRTVKRPHHATTRAEARVHLAGDLLAPPLDAPATAVAERQLEAAGADAPQAEAAVVRAALQSARGDAAQVEAALRAVPADVSVPFRLLMLEARARVARGEAERRAIAEGVKALPASLDEEESARAEALSSGERL